MKILSYVERGDTLVINTDFSLNPQFVYPADKFKNFDELKKQIMRKAEEITIRSQRVNSRREQLKKDLNAEVRRNA